MRKFPRILFFISGSMPTQDDFDTSEKCGPNVAFRNASLVSDEGALETCDGVAGAVPKRYADGRPTAEEAIEKWQVAEMERRQRRAAGLPEPVEAVTVAPKAGTTPPSFANEAAKGHGAVKAPTPTPGAAAGWKANA